MSSDRRTAGLGYSWRFIKIVARVSGNRRTDLRTAGNRSRVRHDRFSYTPRPSCPACNCARTFPPMNGIICRASVSDANEFAPASHRDALQSITSALIGIWRAIRRRIFLALRARSERNQYSVRSARSTSGRAWSMAPWVVPICMSRSRHPHKNARVDAVVGPSSQQSLELSRYRCPELDSAVRLCGEARCRKVAAVRLAGACCGDDLCRSRAKVFESQRS